MKCSLTTFATYPPVQDAFHNGPREKLLYLPCVVPDHSRPDYVATIDVDPESPTFSKVGLGAGCLW